MLIYRFTPGVHAVAGGTPWDDTRTGVDQIASPASRSALYDALADALEAIGYRRYDLKLAGYSGSSNTNKDDLWESEGEAGDKNIVFRTTLSNSGAAGDQYLWRTIGVKRTDDATALPGTITWDGTTTVLMDDTSTIRVGSFIREDADGQWFEVASITPNTSVVIDNSGGWTIPNTGATASSQLTPILEGEIGTQAFVNTPPFTVDPFRWDLGGSDFSTDFQVVGDLDWVWFVVQNTNHTATMFTAGLGDMKPFDMNPNMVILDNDAAAGEFVTLTTLDPATLTAVDPRTLGFRPLDKVRIVEVDPNSTVQAETQLVVEVTSTALVVRRLDRSYTGQDSAVNPIVKGARIAMDPVRIGLWSGSNDEIEPLSFFRNPFFNVTGANSFTDGDLRNPVSPDGDDKYDIHYAQNNTHAQVNDEYGSGITPNERTGRFTTRTVGVVENEIVNVGQFPRLLTYNGTVSYYPHDNMLRDRVSPQEDYVPFRFTSSSSRPYLLGPTPGA